MITISIAESFSRTPGGRFRTDGPFSGEEFREDVLIPQLELNDELSINLDGTRGYPSSFLDEAFAGLVRKLKWKAADFNRRIKIVASGSYSIYADDIKLYVQEASEKVDANGN